MTGLAPEKVKQTFFLLALTSLTIMLLYMLRDYFTSFLGAATFYIIFRTPLHYLTEKKRWPKLLVVIILMLVSVIILVLPLGLLSVMLSSKAQYLIQHYTQMVGSVKEWSNSISGRFGVNLLSDETIGKITSAGATIIPKILSTTLTSLAQLAVLYFLLYFMMMEGHIMEKWVIANAPFKGENTLLLTHELKVQTLSNAIGLPILIIVQATISGIGYWIFGMDEPFFWGVITGFASMIPIIGAAIVWIPLSIFLFASDKHGKGIGVALYNGLLLVNVEHLLRFTLLKKLGNTHPIVTFFGLIIGISLFGFLGLIFGPLLISYFLLLVGIYQKEYLQQPAPLATLDPNEG
jgi:predicted PurR-regulated permease PerM